MRDTDLEVLALEKEQNNLSKYKKRSILKVDDTLAQRNINRLENQSDDDYINELLRGE